jgi:hypothetical protein
MHRAAASWSFVFAAVLGCGEESSDDPSGGSGGQNLGGEAPSGGNATGGNATGGNSTGGNAAGGEGGGGGAPATASLRFIHLSPDGPALDLCLIPADGPPIGPLLENQSLEPGGLGYLGATSYLEVPAGGYQAVLLEAAGTDCDGPALPAQLDLQLEAESSLTVTASGMVAGSAGEQALQLLSYSDDTAGITGKVRQRFINQLVGAPALSLGENAGKNFVPLFTDVAFSQVGDAGGQPYLLTDPQSNIELSLRATGATTDLLTVGGIFIPANEVITSFAVGNLDQQPAAIKVLACLDTSGFCIEFPAD